MGQMRESRAARLCCETLLHDLVRKPKGLCMCVARRLKQMWIVLLFLVIPFTKQFLCAQELPKAPQARIFTLTPTPGYFTEPAVAVNPANPEQVVAVFQDNAQIGRASCRERV